ncbi:MAG: hypothetical protein ACKVS6_01470 [Planctomycetota bacterium]
MNNTPASKSNSDADVKITYRADGKIPMGIWVVWLGFFIYCIFYIIKYVVPDFAKWASEAKF